EVMWAFSEVIDGMAEACRVFDTPVISGNVSFYNETEGRGIHPTPVIGMVGIIEDVRRIIQQGFKRAGHVVALLGETGDDLSVSEYAATIEGRAVEEMTNAGRVPRLDLERERAVQGVVLKAAEAGLLYSAHDCSDGGLAVALAESCFSSLNRAGVGADINLSSEGRTLSVTKLLYSESPSRIIISFGEAALAKIEGIADEAGCPLTVLGRTTDDSHLRIAHDGETVISLGVSEAETAWRSALGKKLGAEALAAVAE
ncbi:MAG TPA: AIR synthase-related protein, partial [Pyrinomonadaceae bacterium]|nr:AIR synthase-related protein [Pyrinomonadaceae bacterium]